jgi:hypothetical protein
LGTSVFYGKDFSQYRGYQFGMPLSAAAEQAGLNPSDAKVVHQRPAVIQELMWRLESPLRAESAKTDPVRDILLRFYSGELFQIVVTYDRYKVQGLTPDDIIRTLSLTYGAATKPTTEILFHSNYGEVAPVLARWEDADYSYNLVRTGDRYSYAMVLYSKRLDALAQRAIVEAARLDAMEAPQKAIDLEKKQAADTQLMLDKARSLNLPNFRP